MKAKRVFDFLLSLILTIILSPLILFLSLIVKIKIGSPVLFKQKRPGLNEKLFKMYKFRTMTDKKGKEGDLLPDKDRITAFGKFLRKMSLDELPELFNVLKGDMSFVGPRPLLTRYLPYYSVQERKRFRMRPGITGLAQIKGRNLLKWDDRLLLDIEYIDNWSLLLDLKILFKTVIKLFKREGVIIIPDSIMEDLDVERGKNGFDRHKTNK